MRPKQSLTKGKKNVINSPFINAEKSYLSPLHIKLGSMKNFVKSIKKTGKGLSKYSFKVSDAKIKERIFVGPQITELIGDQKLMKIIIILKRYILVK